MKINVKYTLVIKDEEITVSKEDLVNLRSQIDQILGRRVVDIINNQRERSPWWTTSSY